MDNFQERRRAHQLLVATRSARRSSELSSHAGGFRRKDTILEHTRRTRITASTPSHTHENIAVSLLNVRKQGGKDGRRGPPRL